MSEQNDNLIYEFAGFSVDVIRRRLLHDEIPVTLTSKAFDTLLILIDQRGSTVSKLELMNAVWGDTAVEENNLTQQISALRRALGERPNEHRFIVTVPGRGYKFVADIRHDRLEEKHRETVLRSVWLNGVDPAVLRGYALALSFIVVIGLGFVWSAVRNSISGRPQTVAVLNFKVSASGDEYIGDGISQTLRARLGSVEDLNVRPGDAVLADQDAIAAGRRLQADTVVTGSVQRDHDRIRVAVEMLDVADGRIVWGRTFDDSASNLFALQDSITREVALELNISLVSRVVDAGWLLLSASTDLEKMLTVKPETISV